MGIFQKMFGTGKPSSGNGSGNAQPSDERSKYNARYSELRGKGYTPPEAIATIDSEKRNRSGAWAPPRESRQPQQPSPKRGNSSLKRHAKSFVRSGEAVASNLKESGFLSSPFRDVHVSSKKGGGGVQSMFRDDFNKNRAKMFGWKDDKPKKKHSKAKMSKSGRSITINLR